MRRLLPLHRAVLSVAVGLLSIAPLDGTARASDPQKLAAQVEIRRTEYGVPHIKAETLEAAAFGLAYCQGQDHAENILNSILRARGELALHFGGEGNVASDFLHRQYRVHARAAETFHRLDADYRSMVEGFSAGLNYYVERHREQLPDWVPHVTPHDVAAHGLAGVARFAFNRARIVDRFLRSQGDLADADVAGKHDDMPLGSNMIALAPERTTSGHAILLGNPHQAWSQVATYYEAHLTVPGELDFYGSTFVGRPVLTTGFNANLGWSHTVNYPDLEEIYALDVDPQRADHYLFDGGSLPITAEEAVVRVREEGGIGERRRTFWYTPLGPVIHRAAEKIYVLRSAAYDEFRSYQQWLRMAQADDLESFRDALAIGAIPMFNICYGDREGNIFYLWNGMVPDLPHPPHDAEAVAAAGSDQIWTRFHPHDELMQLVNPPGGYVQNCNSPPYLTNLHAPLDRAKYAAHFPRNFLGLRTQHCLELVHNERKYSLDDIVELKHSPRMLLAERLKDDLLAVVREQQPSGKVARAVELLTHWDNTARAESRGSVLFAEWWKQYSPDGRYQGFAEDFDPEHPLATPRGLEHPGRAVEALLEAIDSVEERYGAIDVTWGDVHRVRRGEVDVPVSGGSGFLGCFRVLGFRDEPDGKRAVSGGDSWVFVVEFGPQVRARTVIGYSQSEVPSSPYFSDQCEMYARGEMKPAAFTEEEIAAALVERYRPGEE